MKLKLKIKQKLIVKEGGHDYRYALNSNKISEHWWKPKIKFDDGLETILLFENKKFLKYF